MPILWQTYLLVEGGPYCFVLWLRLTELLVEGSLVIAQLLVEALVRACLVLIRRFCEGLA